MIILINNNQYINLSEYKKEFISVEIKGEVKNPGVYNMKENSKINDVIKKAGGLKKRADDTVINRNEVLSDKQVILISKKSKEEKISINTASIERLIKLKGIGKNTAKKIIYYRKEHNGFKSIEEIKKIKGIKEKLFLKIKEKISL